MTTLWIIAAVAGTVLVAGVAFLLLKRDDEEEVWPARVSQPWDRPAERDGARPAPPAAGVPIVWASEEGYALMSQELVLDDDEPSGPIPKIVVRAAGRSDPGRRRDQNEDALLVWPEHEIYAIADGMGGYAAGEVASQIAVDTIREAFERGAHGELEPGIPRRAAELAAAIRAAHARIRAVAARDAAKSGMGTTVVAARFSRSKRRVYVAHVGDSRCYRIRDGAMKALTVDHTLASMGIEGPTAAKLSRAVGAFEALEVDVTSDEAEPGDLYLLCSDGLYKMLPEGVILATLGRLVAAGTALQEVVDALVDAANAAGGRDNVSVVLVSVDDPDPRFRESGEHRISG